MVLKDEGDDTVAEDMPIADEVKEYPEVERFPTSKRVRIDGKRSVY